MRVSRIYQNVTLQTGQTVPLTPHKAHYIKHVLRLKSDQTLTLFNGQGGEYEAHITNIDKKKVHVHIDAFHDVNRESPLQLHIGQGIAKGDRMDFVLQKAVELGINEITPLFTARCNVRLSKERQLNRMQHWQGVIESACEQAGRNCLPILHSPTLFNDWISAMNIKCRVILSHRASLKLSDFKTAHAATDEVVLLVGPEGGFTAQEVQLAEKHKFQAVRLGARIMRTETAAIAAISALQSQWGDF